MFGAFGRSAAERGVEAAGPGDAVSPGARCATRNRCLFAVRSAAELGSEGRPQGGRHHRQAECITRVAAGQRATSHLRSSPGDCAGATETGHARCRGSNGTNSVVGVAWNVDRPTWVMLEQGMMPRHEVGSWCVAGLRCPCCVDRGRNCVGSVDGLGFDSAAGDVDRGVRGWAGGSVGHVEVFRMDGVGTSIVGRPRRLSADRRARPTYTVIWEEPRKCT